MREVAGRYEAELLEGLAELLWEDPLVTWELRELEAELLEVLPELL